MKLHLDALHDRAAWEKAGFELPQFDLNAVKENTRKAPRWLHFGGGNIFRAFPAAVLQRLLNEGHCDTGLVVAECHDGDIIERAYTPFDNLFVLCTLGADGSVYADARQRIRQAAIPADAMRFMGERAQSHTVEIAASHAVTVSHPAAVADLIDRAATSTTT